MASKTSTEVIYRSHEDWELWKTLFISKAVAADLLDYIEGRAEAPTLPVYPTTDRYPKNVRVLRTITVNSDGNTVINATTSPPAANTRNAHRTSTEPGSSGGTSATHQGATAPPLVPTVWWEDTDHATLRATTFADLSKANQENVRFEVSQFTYLKQVYDDIQKQVRLLKEWVQASVSKPLLKVLCPEKQSLREWYEKIQTHAQPSRAAEIERAAEEYQEHLASITKYKSRLIDWGTQWHTLITAARNAEVSDCLQAERWFPSFIKALLKVPALENWATAAHGDKRERIMRQEMTVDQLAAEFMSYLNFIQPKKPTRRGSFLTLHDREPDDDEQPESAPTKRSPPPAGRQKKPPQPHARHNTRGTASAPQSVHDSDEHQSDATERGRPTKKRLREPSRSNSRAPTRSNSRAPSTRATSRSRERHPRADQQSKRVKFDPYTYKGEDCLACLGNHPLDQCFYVFADLAPYGWNIRSSQQKLVDARVAEKQELRETIAEINAKRNSRS